MTDLFDQASDIEEQHRDLSIRAARAKNQPIKYTGHCLYCNELLTIGRFCSAECREDQELADKCHTIRGSYR